MSALRPQITIGVMGLMALSVLVNVFFFQEINPRPASTRAEAARALAEAVSGNGAGAAQSTGKSTADKQPSKAEAPAAANHETLRAIQRELAQRNYEPGAADGRIGMVTRAAIMAYEADYGLPLTGEPSDALLRHIVLASLSRPSPATLPPQKVAAPAAEHLIRTVQQSLSSLGYFTARVDGRPGEATARAIREYEMDQRMPQTGRISAQLLTRLAQTVVDGRKAQR